MVIRSLTLAGVMTVTVSNSELVDRFFDDDGLAVANNMAICEIEGMGRYIQGYGHAVYAFEPEYMDVGVLAFDGWRTASHSSSQHMGLIRPEADVVLDGRAKEHHIAKERSMDYFEMLTDSGTDYGGFHDSVGRA